jgi:hypothetical protein
MKNIKKFNEFEQSNEEINLKNILGSAAIAAGLALGSPDSAKASDNVDKTEMTSSYGDDISTVIKVDSTMKKADIYKNIMASLRSSRNFRITSSNENQINCTVVMSASPKKGNGQTTGDMTILIKDGRFKVEFSNIKFTYSGYQKPSVGDQIERNVKNQARQVLIQKVSQSIPNRQLGNMVGGVLNTATHPNNQQTQYKNFTYEEAKADSKLSDYVDSVNSEMSGIIKKLENSAKNNTTSSNEDW